MQKQKHEKPCRAYVIQTSAAVQKKILYVEKENTL